MREDERETLADIVQNIDEQEIFMEFIAKAETIKESWQIAKIFEDKKREFMASIGEYDAIIRDKEQELKAITNEINDANILLKDANNELERLRGELDSMKQKAQFYKTKIMQAQQSAVNEDMKESFLSGSFEDSADSSNILDFSGILQEFQPLASVSVHIKNGATAMARAAQIIYEEALYEVYKMAAKRLYKLKDRISELELANQKLSIELRDLSEEDNFKENLRGLDSMESFDENYGVEKPRLKVVDSRDSRLDSMSRLESRLDSRDSRDEAFEKINFDKEREASLNDRMNRLDKKKEKVEEMFQQINDFLQEESRSEANIDDIRSAIQDTIKNINKGN